MSGTGTTLPDTTYVPGADFSGTGAAPLSGPAAGGGAGGGISSLFSNLTSNPTALLGAGALGLEAIKQMQPLPEQTQLNQQAAQAAATGKQLSSYLTTGTLPPGAQEAVNLGKTAAQSQIRSTAAQLGLTGSTWEADKLAQIDQATAAQSAQIATNLLQTGANYTQLSSGIYENLLNQTLAQDKDFQQALSTFAGGLAGARLGQGGATG